MLNGRDAPKLDRAAAALRDAGIAVELAAFDVTDPAAVTAGVARSEAECGPIEVLVNNAGIQRRASLEDFPTETWRELMQTNLDSVFYVAQAVVWRKARLRGAEAHFGMTLQPAVESDTHPLSLASRTWVWNVATGSGACYRSPAKRWRSSASDKHRLAATQRPIAPASIGCR